MQFQAPFPEREADGGYGWLHDTSILLVLNDSSIVKGRALVQNKNRRQRRSRRKEVETIKQQSAAYGAAKA